MSRPSTSTRSSATDAVVTFGVLGPLEVREGSSLLDVPGRQERTLLALLLTAPGRVFSVSAIVKAIWGDEPPAGAEKTVQSYVSRLRRALPGDGSSVVLTRSPGYLAAVEPMHVDAERFRTLAAAGRRDIAVGRPEAAAVELRDALGLWRGEAYTEFDAPFAMAERTALEELRLAALEDRIAADLAVGAGPELVAELETLVGRHPWRERLWAQLMTALYRSGRQVDALGAFQRARTSLVDELGVEPGPDLRAVEALVLAQDARLLGPDRSPEASAPTLTVIGPTFVGREAELAGLLEAYDRAAKGSVERVVLTGRHGMGKTRLLAELTREAQARGGLVRYGASEAWAQQTGVPVVILLDDLHRASTGELTGLTERFVAARPPLLVVGSCVVEDLTAEQDATISRMFRERMPLPSLAARDIAEIVGLYVPSEAVEGAVEAVAGAGGVPLQVHAEASRYGEELAAAQVEEAAAGISGPRRHLSSSQERVADGVFDLQRIRLVRAAHGPAESPRVVCPYKGLAFFDVDDAPYFFGRERLVARLVARLVDARLLAVVGASGSGKSSVIRAGLVAAIRAGVLPGSERWRTVLTTPTQPPPELAADGARTLLVVDQFEELFTALSPTQQEKYADWLAAMAAQEDVTVVVAVRSDYYAPATAYRQVSDLMAADTVLIGEMSPDELRQAVELPAAAAGLELEPGLADTVTGDVAGEPGGLPLMSTALLSLWERRDGHRLSLAAYHEMGGVRTAVARLAETAYAQLTPDQQTVARRTLLRLAETGEGGEPVRRRVPMGELAPKGDDDARTVLDMLAARRLLTVSETHAEVAHEALLREWPRLRAWLDEDVAGRTLRRHLAPAAYDWQASGRDAGELYRGPRLAAALDWQRDHPDELTEVEHDFLRTSRHATEAEALRRRRSIRRLRSLAAGLAAVLALALIAGAFAVNQRNDATEASLEADVRALQASALSEDRWDRALLYAAQAQRFDASADSRAALLQTVQRGPEATAIFTADQPLHSIAVSADGTRLAAGDSLGTVHVWDSGTRQRVQIPGVSTFEAAALDMSPDGRYIVVVGIPVSLYAENLLKWHTIVIDLETQPPTVRFQPHPRIPDGTVQGVTAARFAADGRTLVTVEFDGVIRYMDVESGDVKRTLEFKHIGSRCGDVPPGRLFMVACNDDTGVLTAWGVDSGRQVWSSVEPDGTVAAISPDGSQLVIGHADGRVERIDVNTGARTVVTPSLADGLVDITWSPDGVTFAGVTQDRTVSIWDADTLQSPVVLRGHRGEVTQAVYSLDGETIYAAGLDGSVLAWDVTGRKGIVKDGGVNPTPGVELAALASDGSVAAVSYPDRRVEVFEVASGRAFEVVAPEEPIFLTIDRLGRSVVLGAIEDRAGPKAFWARTVDVQRGELLPYRIELDIISAAEAAVTWDNEAVLAAGQQQVGLWNRITGIPEAPELFEATGAVAGSAMHPDGRWAALSESDLIEVIDLGTGDLVAQIDKPAALGGSLPLFPLVFSPDGRWLAAATGGGRVVVWDTRTWEQHSTWTAVRGFGIDSMVFTPDSGFLVTGGAGEAAIWNVEQGASGGVQLDVDPSRPDADVLVGVRDDGTLVTFTDGSGLREWAVAPEGLLEQACMVAGRNLTQQEWDDVLPDRPYQHTCPEYPDG